MKKKTRNKRGSHLCITKMKPSKEARTKKREIRKQSKELFRPKRKKIQFRNIFKLAFVLLVFVLMYITISNLCNLNHINDSLNTITDKLDNITEKQQEIETKQEEMTNEIEAVKVSKAEKKEAEEKAKQEAEEKAKQEAIKVAQVKTTQVTSRGSSTVRATSGTKAEYQSYAHDLCINTYGWTESDFDCLVKLWNRESGWNPNAHNSSSGAHGIPQSLPASKMASEGDDYYTNGKTQIRWGLKYIKNRYGNPTNAWAHSESHNWY